MPGARLEGWDRVEPERAHRDGHRAGHVPTSAALGADLELNVADESEGGCLGIHEKSYRPHDDPT